MTPDIGNLNLKEQTFDEGHIKKSLNAEFKEPIIGSLNIEEKGAI